jgi:hypothetical protein
MERSHVDIREPLQRRLANNISPTSYRTSPNSDSDLPAESSAWVIVPTRAQAVGRNSIDGQIKEFENE